MIHECESWDTYKSSYTCFDRKSITDSFLRGCQADIDQIIDQLESMTGTQESVNEIYNDFNKVLKTEMDKKLKHKQIHIKVGQNNKSRRIKKPWGNDLLTSMWNEVCREEKNMIKSNGVARKHARQAFKHKRKIFD